MNVLCKETYEEERSFWEEIKEEFFSLMNKLYQHLRSLHVSYYEGISDIMDFIFPRGKDTIYNSFNSSVEHTEIPPIKNVRIVHYDEQHPKEGKEPKNTD